MEQVQRESTERRMIKGVVIPTLTRGTAEEEKEKALKSLEGEAFKQKMYIKDLERKYRLVYDAESSQRVELRALKNRMHLAFAGLFVADAVFILILAKMLIK
jgi:hypothetical protein